MKVGGGTIEIYFLETNVSNNVREIQNATHSFRSEKFLHHRVQRVSKPH
jgi:hypothetical protein